MFHFIYIIYNTYNYINQCVYTYIAKYIVCWDYHHKVSQTKWLKAMETFCLIASEPGSLRWRYWQGCFLLRTMRGKICLGHLPQFLVLWQSGVPWLVEASFPLCFHLYMGGAGCVWGVCVCICLSLSVCVCVSVSVCMCVCLGLNLSFSYKDTCPPGLGPTEWPHSDFLG